MQIILLERIARLGNLGDIVNVKNGFARNFLLPKKKALRATEANKAIFEKQRSELEAKHLDQKEKASILAEKLSDKSFTIVRAAGETGHLYGSVSTKDIANLLSREGYNLSPTQIILNIPLKTIGSHKVSISLHSDVSVNIFIKLARSIDEAAKMDEPTTKEDVAIEN